MAGGAAAVGTEEACARLDVSGQLTLVSDYRFRGVTNSSFDPAVQAGVTVQGQWGFSAGVWASTVGGLNGAEAEIDVFAAKSFKVKKAKVSVGGIGYLYPGGNNLNYGEATATISRQFKRANVTIGANYALPQPSLNNKDNIYAYSNVNVPLARLGKTPVSLSAGFGVEQGAFAPRRKLDWSLGASATVKGFTLGAAYIDSDRPARSARGGAVFSISRAF